MGVLRVVATDYDGTLTSAGPPAPATLDALAQARRHGLTVVLATGRILSELRHEFPAVDAHVDAIVAENGAVLAMDGRTEPLAGAVDDDVVIRMRELGVPHRRGQVIVAAHADRRRAIREIVEHHAPDLQIISNRSELMVMPAGVTKATGLEAALAALGTSVHNTVAIGDGENDAAMLLACEVGVATANAVPALKRRADLVTAGSAGAGVVELLGGSVVAGRERVHSGRWRLVVGHDSGGHPVTIPSSQINVLIQGGSGAGKSRTAGMLAEQLIHLSYSVLVIDPEGDHEQLGALPGVFVTGGSRPILPADQIVALLRHRASSVVVDLSMRPFEEVDAFYRMLPPLLEASRTASGLPHWILIDEAHQPLGQSSGLSHFFTPEHLGYLLVTYEPGQLVPEVRDSIDVDLDLDLGSIPPTLAVRSRGAPGAQRCWVGSRRTPHVRHWHKYATTTLSRERGFWFRPDPGQLTGAVATSLAEFHREVRCCAPAVLGHHARRHDFSRWIGSVFVDVELAQAVSGLEDELSRVDDGEAIEVLRHRLLVMLEEQLVVTPRARPDEP